MENNSQFLRLKLQIDPGLFSVPFETTYGSDSVKHSVLLMRYLMSIVYASKQEFLRNRR